MLKHSVFELDNGLRVVIIPNKNVQSVTMHFRGSAGSNVENNDQIGISHLLEHYISASQRNLLSKITFYGGYFVGITSRDDVLYMVKTTKDHTDHSLEFAKKVLTVKNFDPDLINVQKKIISNEIDRIYINPERMIIRESNKILFDNSRMEKLNIGDKSDIKNISTDNIKSFYRKHYYPGRFVMALAGNVNPEEIKNKINKNFSELKPSGTGEPAGYRLTKIDDLVVNSVKYLNTTQFICNLDYYSGTIQSADYIKDNVCAGLLNEGLNMIIKNKLGMVYQISCTNMATSKYGKISVRFASSIESGPKVIKIIKDLIREISGSFDKQEIKKRIEGVKNQISARLLFNLEKSSGSAYYYSYSYLHDALIKDPAAESAAIKKLSSKDINENFSKLFNQKPKITIITGGPVNEDDIKKSWN